MVIRPAILADVPALAAMEGACLPADAWSAASLSSQVEEPTVCTLIACDGDGTVTGYVSARLLPPEAEIYRVATLPAHRRRGIARALLSHLLSAARKEGCSAFFLEVRASNLPARALYASLGFAETGVRRSYYRDPREDAVLMSVTCEVSDADTGL